MQSSRTDSRQASKISSALLLSQNSVCQVVDLWLVQERCLTSTSNWKSALLVELHLLLEFFALQVVQEAFVRVLWRIQASCCWVVHVVD